MPFRSSSFCAPQFPGIHPRDILKLLKASSPFSLLQGTLVEKTSQHTWTQTYHRQAASSGVAFLSTPNVIAKVAVVQSVEVPHVQGSTGAREHRSKGAQDQANAHSLLPPYLFTSDLRGFNVSQPAQTRISTLHPPPKFAAHCFRLVVS